MKTAMQELINDLSNNIVISIFERIEREGIFIKALEKEKEQLIKAHIDGFDHIVVDFKKQEYAEQYYNETYNQ